MLYFGRLKTALILGACLLGLLLCLPNVLPRPAAWVPWRTVHLGLDLRGGSYLLMRGATLSKSQSCMDCCRISATLFHVCMRHGDEPNCVDRGL